jgi:hypothetical protein
MTTEFDNVQYYEAMSNLFSNSEAGPEAAVERGAPVVGAVGKSFRGGRRTALYGNIDVLGALSKPLGVYFNTDFAMDASTAAVASANLLRRCELHAEAENVQFYFLQAMQLCYAANSASVLMPGRAEFVVMVGGVPSVFNLFRDVVDVLGADTRRYFRAFADETRTCLLNLKQQYDSGPTGSSAQEQEEYEQVQDMWDAIVRVAKNRGLGRVPHLVHDSAENCKGLTETEHAFLVASKKTIFEGMHVNAVDNPVVVRAGVGNRVGAVNAREAAGVPDDSY